MNYKFQIANFNDIKEIANLEKNFFEEGIAYTEEFIEDWMKHNQEMFYVIKDEFDQVKGHTILVPVTEECYKKLHSGQINEMLNFKKEDVLKNLESNYHYTASIVVASDTDNNAFMTLIGGIISIFDKYGHNIITTPIREEGLRLTKILGYKPITKEGLENNYEIIISSDANDPHRKRFKRFIKKIER